MIKATPRDLTSGMNKTEAGYAMVLEARRQAGAIQSWAYEAIKLRLADGAFYTPDFFIVMPDNTVELHETKGFMREAARVRLLVAMDRHPFTFRLIKKVGHCYEEHQV